MNEIITIVINALLGSGLIATFIFYNSKKRKANAEASLKEAEATKVETDNISSFAEEWKELFHKQEQKTEAKEQKIDNLYNLITEWRDKYNTLANKKAKIEIENHALEFRLCNVKLCAKREPQTGY